MALSHDCIDIHRLHSSPLTPTTYHRTLPMQPTPILRYTLSIYDLPRPHWPTMLYTDTTTSTYSHAINDTMFPMMRRIS